MTDHYAIIPTEQVKDPERLPEDERKIYDLIIRRLIAAHYEKAVFDYTTILTLVDKRAEFVSKGKQLIQEGWRKVIFQKDSEEEDVLLPNLQEGESGKVSKVKVKEGQTQPPKRYTEGQLITLMKTAGKHLDNDELEKILSKTEGLGTEATRAGIITMLKDRKYIEVKRNQVYATDKGKILIHAIGDKILASPEMTAKWEQRLHEIGKGQAKPAVFMEAVKKMSSKIITDTVDHAARWDFSGMDIESVQGTGKRKRRSAASLGSCKLCGDKVIDKGTFYGCAGYQKTKCQFTISKKILGQKISAANVKKILSEGQSAVIKGFKKGENAFDAALKWSEMEKKLNFDFPSLKKEAR